MFEIEKNIRCFFDELNQSSIDYILIKNIGHELPGKLPVGKDIDILVNPADKELFRSKMKKIGRRINHPYSSYNGWTNLYGLPEFEFWRIFRSYDLIIDVTYQLCCMSLMPKTWLPLDKHIQESAWKNKVWNDELICWTLDNNTLYVYYLARCIFDKKSFSDKYLSELQHLKDSIDIKAVEKMLNFIFYKFTSRLLKLLQEEKYNDIRTEYLRFIDY